LWLISLRLICGAMFDPSPEEALAGVPTQKPEYPGNLVSNGLEPSLRTGNEARRSFTDAF